MLGKIGFGFVLLIFISLSFGIDAFLENFEKPWNYEYKWPNNASVVDYSLVPILSPAWNVYAAQTSLDTLAITAIEDPYSQTTRITNAKKNYYETKNIVAQITEFVDYGTLPFIVAPDKFCTNLLELDAQQCMCALGLNPMECAGMSKEFRYMLAKRIFSNDYAALWKWTMNLSLNALENSSSDLNKAIYALESNYDEVAFSGICELGSVGYEICENVSLFFAALNGSNIKNYEDFGKIRSALVSNYFSVYDDVPHIEFGWLINLIGGEKNANTAIGKIKLLDSKLNEYSNAMKRRYNALSDEVKVVINEAEVLGKSVSAERLEKIYASPFFKDIVGNDVASVNERCEKGRTLLSLARANKSSAEFAQMYREKDYLRASIVNMNDARVSARIAKNEFDIAKDNAKEIVSSYEISAEEWLSKVENRFMNTIMPERASAFYDLAKNNFIDGKNADRIGDKFERYASAIKNAKSAYLILPENEKDTNWTSIVSCSEAENLMTRANKDEIDTIRERALYSILTKNNNVSELISGCDNIKERIIDSAKYKYSELDGLMNEISRFIALCGSDCEDLKSELKAKQHGIAINGALVYPDCIGSLKELQDSLIDIKNDVVKNIKSLVGNHLFVRKTFFADHAVLDRATNVRLEITVANTVEYPGENLRVDIETPIEFSLEDAVYGANDLRGVVYLNGKLSIYIKSINASERKMFIFEKDNVLLKTNKITKKAFGEEDYSARIIENRDVVCTNDITNFYIDEKWGMLLIDGGPVALDNGFVRKYISKGEHKFEARYSVVDAYSKQITGNTSTKAGERIYYKYMIELAPKIDMEYVQIFAPMASNNYIKEKKVITVTGEKINTVESTTGFVIKIFGLLQNKPASLEINYYVDNSSEYAKEEIDKLEKLNLSNVSKAIINEAKGALLQNDGQTVVEKIQNVYENIEREKIDVAKMQKRCDEYHALISQELNKIENVLGVKEERDSDAKEKNEFTDTLFMRYNFLKDILNELDGKTLVEQLTILETYNSKWISNYLQTFKKNASAKINIMYAKYLEIENNYKNYDNSYIDDELATEFVLLKNLYRKFDIGNLLEDGYALATAIEKTAVHMEDLEKRIAAKHSWVISDIDALRNGIGESLKKYGNEYSNAKGTRFESFFKIKNDDAQNILKQADSALKKRDITNINTISKLYQKLLAIDNNITTTLSYLETRASNDSVQVRNIVSLSSKKLPEKDYKKISSLIITMDDYLSKTEWIKTMKTQDEILKIISSYETNTNYDVVLWLSGIFVCGVIMLYYFKGRGGSLSDMHSQILKFLKLGGTKKQKAFKKLKKAD
ncbi:MAG: hypothetical protein AB1391_02090 [Candidatus Micrarchaeota archaeon]